MFGGDREVQRKVETVPYSGGTVPGVTRSSKGLSLTKSNFRLKITNQFSRAFNIALTERIGKDILAGNLVTKDNVDRGGTLLITDNAIWTETDRDGTLSLLGESLTPGFSVEEFLSYVNSGAIQLTEIKVESQNDTLQTSQNFQVNTFRPWNRPSPQIINVSALKSQDNENRYVVGPFEVPGECILSYRSNLEYTVLGATGETPNVVIIDLFFANDTEHADITRNLLATR